MNYPGSPGVEAQNQLFEAEARIEELETEVDKLESDLYDAYKDNENLKAEIERLEGELRAKQDDAYQIAKKYLNDGDRDAMDLSFKVSSDGYDLYHEMEFASEKDAKITLDQIESYSYPEHLYTVSYSVKGSCLIMKASFNIRKIVDEIAQKFTQSTSLLERFMPNKNNESLAHVISRIMHGQTDTVINCHLLPGETTTSIRKSLGLMVEKEEASDE